MPKEKNARRRGAGAGRRFEKLVEVMARLRGPGGCPWDREQTHESLRPYLLEETYEVLEALDSGDDKRLVSELGDLLLQVVFHARLAEEEGRFDIGDVAEAIREKLIRRHPHVFGSARARNAAEVLQRGEELKAEERRAEGGPERGSVLDGLPKHLPGLSEAFQLGRRAANAGFDWPNLEGVLEKVQEEARELREAARGERRARTARGRAFARLEEEAGDLLFAAANVARFLGIDPEIALKKANRKFAERFRSMERQAAKAGGRSGAGRKGRLAEFSVEELDQLWNRAKAHKRK